MEIGGYLNIELNEINKEYYNDLYRFNTGRNALAYLVLAKKYKKVYLPYYTCGVIIETLKEHHLKIVFYSINEHLEINEIPSIRKDECIIYTNYFGLKDKYISFLCLQLQNVIIDNAQAFFSPAVTNIDTIYSPRKFFGVPDGAYLSSNISIKQTLDKDVSYKRFKHLIKRVDVGAEVAYNDFKENDKRLKGEPIKMMSELTFQILSRGINYDFVKKRRTDNYYYLHKHLKKANQLNIEFDPKSAPMVYPFLIENSELKQLFISNKIFVATYWPDVLERCSSNSLESYLTKYILPLPIDQRYGLKEMERIVSLIL